MPELRRIKKGACTCPHHTHELYVVEKSVEATVGPAELKENCGAAYSENMYSYPATVYGP